MCYRCITGCIFNYYRCITGCITSVLQGVYIIIIYTYFKKKFKNTATDLRPIYTGHRSVANQRPISVANRSLIRDRFATDRYGR